MCGKVPFSSALLFLLDVTVDGCGSLFASAHGKAVRWRLRSLRHRRHIHRGGWSGRPAIGHDTAMAVGFRPGVVERIRGLGLVPMAMIMVSTSSVNSLPSFYNPRATAAAFIRLAQFHLNTLHAANAAFGIAENLHRVRQSFENNAFLLCVLHFFGTCGEALPCRGDKQCRRLRRPDALHSVRHPSPHCRRPQPQLFC